RRWNPSVSRNGCPLEVVSGTTDISAVPYSGLSGSAYASDGTTAWVECGRAFCAKGEPHGMQSHAYLRAPFRLDADVIRVYVAFLDAERVGRVGWVDVRADDPTTVTGISNAPALSLGDPGSFDDNGVTPMCVVRDDEDALRLYYTGWQLFQSVRYLMLTGAAASRDGGHTFERLQTTPVLDRTSKELIARTAAYVVRDGATWRVW